MSNKVFKIQVTYDDGQTSIGYFLNRTPLASIREAKSLNRAGVVFDVIEDED